MTAPITITLDDQQVRAALDRLAARVADPTPAMREIGEMPWTLPRDFSTA